MSAGFSRDLGFQLPGFNSPDPKSARTPNKLQTLVSHKHTSKASDIASCGTKSVPGQDTRLEPGLGAEGRPTSQKHSTRMRAHRESGDASPEEGLQAVAVAAASMRSLGPAAVKRRCGMTSPANT